MRRTWPLLEAVAEHHYPPCLNHIISAITTNVPPYKIACAISCRRGSPSSRNRFTTRRRSSPRGERDARDRERCDDRVQTWVGVEGKDVHREATCFEITLFDSSDVQA